MARPRSFDTEEALDRALRLFWTRGYAGTSLDDLARTMGLSRSSFYGAFGSKHALFLTSLERYTAQVGDALTRIAAEPLPTLRLLARLMTRVLDLTSIGAQKRGCFLGNTSLDLGSRDARAQRRVQAGLHAVENIFAEVVRRGVACGELPATVDAVRAGQFLTSSLQGMLVMGRAGASAAELTSLQETALSTLTREAPP